jgi:uncharacterized membrane protein
MTLSESGESRVNGYLYVLERSLAAFLPRDTVRDAVREIESHLRERIAAADMAPNERVVLEKILSELGPPLRVAQAYSAERTVEEAVTTGRFIAMLRAIWQLAVTTLSGFGMAIVFFTGYASAFAFFAIAALKPIFPDNVGIQFIHGMPIGLGVHFPGPPPGSELRGGYWVMPFAAICGLGILVGTHRGARAFLARWRARRASHYD